MNASPKPRLLKLVAALALALGAAPPPQAQGAGLQVGFAEIDITPELTEDRPVWIAGYGHGRRAIAIHDPIMARCAVLSDGTRSFALVGADLVGLQLPEVDRIRAATPEIDRLIVCSSHNHEGPDVIGIWGRTPIKRGVDEAYLDELVDKIARCIKQAKARLAPAAAQFGTAEDESLLGDSRLPKAYDGILRVLQFNPPGSDKTSGLIVQWNCHPEALGPDNTELTADFPATTVSALEAKYDCPIVYLTGAVGGLMAPPRDRIRDADGTELLEGDFRYAQAYGEAVAALAGKAIGATTPIELTPFEARSRELFLPVSNSYYRAAFTAGVLTRGAFVDTGDPEVGGAAFKLTDTFKKMAIRTELNLWRLGELDLIGIPGEIYPELIYGTFQEPGEPNTDFPDAPLEPTVAELFQGRRWMLAGLANDEVGYIIPKRQWDYKKPYAYGRSKSQYGELNSCSPEVAPILMGALAGMSRDKLRILSYNVWYGFTKKPDRKERWLTWMREQAADITALQELNGYTAEQLQKDATHWGHPHSALLKEEGFSTGLTSKFPIDEVVRMRDGFHHGLLQPVS